MDPDRLPRKLAAILYADVADYSRLTGEDEDATHRRLSEYLDVISGSVEHQHGRVMHYAGDAVLAMFEAVVDALSCASIIQSDLKERNADLPKERKLQFRIGVNLGDVIEDRGDIYDDGVNIAARLEGLAEPGGICVSESVYDAVSNSLPFSYAFMGEQKVKNIEKPVRVYRVMPAEDSNGSATSESVPAGGDEQEIRFCTSSDGVGIAYATVGEGPPLVNELQRITTSPENAARLRLAMGEIDVMSLLPQISTPTLVLHTREDSVAAFDGGRKMASMIPGARFVPLESANHLLIKSEPAWPRFLAEVRSFLGSLFTTTSARTTGPGCRRRYLPGAIGGALQGQNYLQHALPPSRSPGTSGWPHAVPCSQRASLPVAFGSPCCHR